MGKETISQTTFLKGLTTGAVIAASLGILSIGEYSIDSIHSKNAYPSADAPQITASATPTDLDNIKIESTPSPEIEIINETETEAEMETETETETETKTETETETKTETETETETKTETETEPTTKSDKDAASETVKFGPGTYSATASGISSEITVSAIFNEKRIIKISTDVSGETSRIGAESGEVLIRKALAAQSAEFDGISGATITSDAFKEALNDCITQAKENKGNSAAEGVDDLTSLFLPGILNSRTRTENTESQTDSETETESEDKSENESEFETASEYKNKSKPDSPKKSGSTDKTRR